MLMRRVLGASIVVASAVLATACAPSIRSERDESVPVPKGATWAWAAGESGAAARDSSARGYLSERYRAPSIFDPIVQQRFRRAIAIAMAERGFRQAPDASRADFLLGFTLGVPEAAYRQRAVRTHAALGVYGGWGYSPWAFYRPYGFFPARGWYEPWGGWGWAPWGWGPWWGGWSFGVAAYPAYGYGGYPYGARAYEETSLVVELRQRSDGDLAWMGRYRTEPDAVRRMSPEKVQAVVDKLFATLH